MLSRLLVLGCLAVLAGCTVPPQHNFGHVTPSASASNNSEPANGNSLPRGFDRVQ